MRLLYGGCACLFLIFIIFFLPNHRISQKLRKVKFKELTFSYFWVSLYSKSNVHNFEQNVRCLEFLVEVRLYEPIGLLSNTWKLHYPSSFALQKLFSFVENPLKKTFYLELIFFTIALFQRRHFCTQFKNINNARNIRIIMNFVSIEIER